jgi:hypothetical protein
LSPIIEAIKVVRKKILQKAAGSLKTKIPTKTVPTAPIPVHTAYAVPMGKTWVALYSKTILIERHTKKPSIQYVDTIPLVSLALPKHDANPTSKNPAMTNKIQFIFILLKLITKMRKVTANL